VPAPPAPPTLSDDENLVLALRLRDGRPNPVPGHLREGACRYARHYPEGGCDWCSALAQREAGTESEVPPNVIVMSHHRPQADDNAPARRIA
jgi:hypothetical protein